MQPAWILAGALAACVLGGFLPWANAEAAIAGAALLLPRAALPLLVLGAASAQLIAKGVVYAAVRRAPERLPERARPALARLHGLARRPHALLLTVLASSALGVPPFYLVTLACGAAAAPRGAFLATAFVGLLLRYGFVIGAALFAWGRR